MRYFIACLVILVAAVALCGCQSVKYDPAAPAAARIAGMLAVRAATAASDQVTVARLQLARPVLADAEEVLRAEAPARPAVLARIVLERLDRALVGLEPGDVAILRESVAAVLAGVRVENETIDERQAAIVAAEFLRGMIIEIDAITGNASAGKRPLGAGGNPPLPVRVDGSERPEGE